MDRRVLPRFVLEKCAWVFLSERWLDSQFCHCLFCGHLGPSGVGINSTQQVAGGPEAQRSGKRMTERSMVANTQAELGAALNVAPKTIES